MGKGILNLALTIAPFLIKLIYYIENINDVAFLTMTKDRFKIYIILAKSFSFIHVKNFITLHYCKLIHINTDEQIIVKFPKTQTPKLPSNITAHRQSRDNSLISYFPLTFNKKKKKSAKNCDMKRKSDSGRWYYSRKGSSR